MSNLKEKVDNLGEVQRLVQQLTTKGAVSSSLREAINSGRVRLLPTTVRIRKEVGAASGEIDLLDPNQDKLVGISDFAGQKLPDGEAFIELSKSVRFSDAADPEKGTYKTTTPTLAHGAEVTTISNGKLITRNSIRDFETEANTVAIGDDVLEYDIPRFYGDGKSFEVKLKFPVGVSLPDAASGAGNCFEVALYGFTTQYS